jgi:hypothetical protein
LGAAVVALGEHVLVYGVRDPGDRALTLLRCDRALLAVGRIARAEVWAGVEHGFSATAQAHPIAGPVANELSITARDGEGYVLVHSYGFGSAKIEALRAHEPTGPFAGAITLFDPGASAQGTSERLVYAGKAHAGLAGADLIVTYVESSLDPERLYSDLSLYFPKFLRVTWPASAPTNP